MSKPCIICGQITNGSIGAAGIAWSRICQACKDIEDKALLSQIKSDCAIFDNALNCFVNSITNPSASQEAERIANGEVK